MVGCSLLAVGDEGELFEEEEHRVVVHRLPKKKEKKEYRVVVHRLPKGTAVDIHTYSSHTP